MAHQADWSQHVDIMRAQRSLHDVTPARIRIFHQTETRHCMSKRFESFLLMSRWASAIVALMYHLRFVLFANYEAVSAKTTISRAFYFLTGLGHESFAVFFVLDGIMAGLILQRRQRGPLLNHTDATQHLSSLYRILVPGLLLGVAFDFTGAHLFNRSGLYTSFPEFSTLTLSYSSLLGNVLMLQPFVVPTFGSNGMLYLLSYLFWYFVLLYVFVRAAELRNPYGLFTRGVLLAMLVLVAPHEFLLWAAIWLSGIAVVFLSEARQLRPPVLAATAAFVVVLVLSRLVGSNTGLLPQPFGNWLVGGKYWLVSAGFAAVAWALYPQPVQVRNQTRVARLDLMHLRLGGQLASFTFLFHFPVIMLLVGLVSTLLDQPLMQQPSPIRYIEFACLVGASVGIAAIVMHCCRRQGAGRLREAA
jgi:hypothetical protein